MDSTVILERGADATFQVVAEEAILIHLRTGAYYSLNKVGTQFWERLDGRQSLAQHATAIAASYEVDEAMVLADLMELAGELMAEDLARRVPPPESVKP